VRLFTLRGPVLRVPWPLVIVAWAGRAGWGVLRWLAAHPIIPLGGVVIGSLWWVASTNLAALVVGVFGIASLAVGGWAEKHGAQSWTALRDLAVTRTRRRRYLRGWEDVMAGCGLVRADVVPVLEDVRVGSIVQDTRRVGDVDVLTVLMAPGQLTDDWRQVGPRLASAWGHRSVRVRPVRDRSELVELQVRHGRPTATSRPAPWAPQLEDEDDQPATAPAPLPELPAPRPSAFPRTPRGAA